MRSPVILTSIIFAAVLGGCGRRGSGAEPNEYTGCATDEHWPIFDEREKRATADDQLAPILIQPSASTALSSDAPVVFRWDRSANDSGEVDGDVPYMGPGCTDCCPQFSRGALAPTHFPAISGNVYDLQLSTNGSVTHRVITSLQQWRAPDDVWRKLGGQRVTLRMWRMTVLRNDVREGPFTTATPFTFTIAP